MIIELASYIIVGATALITCFFAWAIGTSVLHNRDNERKQERYDYELLRKKLSFLENYLDIEQFEETTFQEGYRKKIKSQKK